MKKSDTLPDLPAESPVTTGTYFLLDEDVVTRLIPLAISGDCEGAFRLYQHYQYGGLNLGELASHYLIVGACFGHVVSQYNLAVALMNSGKKVTTGDLQAGYFWLNKAANQGNANAQIELKRVQSDSQYKNYLK